MAESIANVVSLDWTELSTLNTRPVGEAVRVSRHEDVLTAHHAATGRQARWTISRPSSPEQTEGCITLDAAESPQTSSALFLGSLEAAFTFHPELKSLRLSAPEPWLDSVRDTGIVIRDPAGLPRVYREMLWQLPELWLARTTNPAPLQYLITEGKRHPRRLSCPEPGECLYQRHIPWLDQIFSFRALDPDTDLHLLHEWMNEPEVDRIWQESGDLDKHRKYLDQITADPHIYPMLACLDDEPFGYFEAYWAKEDRIGPFCDARDHDRGWHVLIGNPDRRGKIYATSWLTSISHYLFLDDPRTHRVVCEPRADHARQIRNLDLSGYAKIKTFDFPHKRAQLVVLEREHFFGEALWWPNRKAAT